MNILKNHILKKINNNMLPMLLVVFTVTLIVFSSSNLVAAKSGIVLWATSIVPSVFPFFVATELISNTQIPYLLGKIFTPFMNPLFNINGEGSFALIFGIICGYPMGAKITCNLRKQNVLKRDECERLLSFTNNSGPMFILGTVGIMMYGNSLIGFLLLISHILSCLTVGLLFRFWKKNKKNNDRTNIKINQSLNFNGIHLSNLGELLSKSISSSISSIMMVGGFVVLFSVIISIFKTSRLLNILTFIISPSLRVINIPSSFVAPLITGFLEITNGISLISSVPIKAISVNIILTSFLLGIGGLSVFLQVSSIVSKTDISIKPYIYGKLLQGLISALYTFLFMQVFSFFNFNL